MTRKAAIRLLVSSLAGMLVEVIKPQSVTTIGSYSFGDLAKVTLGDPVESAQEARARYQRCEEELKKTHSPFACVNPDWGYGQRLIPGTATMTINLDGWKCFEVTHGGQSVKITREEIWEALQ